MTTKNTPTSATSTKPAAKPKMTLTTRVARLEETTKENSWWSVASDTRVTELERALARVEADLKQTKREALFGLYVALCGAAMMLVLYVAWVVRW